RHRLWCRCRLRFPQRVTCLQFKRLRAAQRLSLWRNLRHDIHSTIRRKCSKVLPHGIGSIHVMHSISRSDKLDRIDVIAKDAGLTRAAPLVRLVDHEARGTEVEVAM